MGNDTHKHKCNGCGHIWEHGNACRGNVEAHTCARCGDEQWSHYRPQDMEEIRDADRAAAEFFFRLLGR